MRKALLYLLLGWLCGAGMQAEEYRLQNGNIIRGEVLSDFTEDGVTIKKASGGFTKRTHWFEFDQDTLKLFSQDRKMARFSLPYVEIPVEELQKPKPIPITEPDKVSRPEKRPSFFASLVNPVGLLMLIAFLLGNGYAGVEVARFRKKPRVLVGALSVVLPIVVPIVFLSIPAHKDEEEEDVPAAGPEAAPTGAETASPGVARSGLSLSTAAAPTAPVAASGGTQVFKRGDTTFNRRFFESQFAGFFRVVPGPAEKDMVFVVRMGRQELVGKRITRISSSELGLLLLSGGEKGIQFANVDEIQVRHKDARD